jgi:hypothetical protein
MLEDIPIEALVDEVDVEELPAVALPVVAKVGTARLNVSTVTNNREKIFFIVLFSFLKI